MNNDLNLSPNKLQEFARFTEAHMRQRVLVSDLYAKKNAFSVTCRLPPNILAMIFSHYVHDYHYHQQGSPAEGAPSWINISHVCRHWRKVALHFPSLWGHIFITSPRWTEELLVRSKQASLKVRGEILFSHDDPTWLSVEKVLLHKERIQELYMALPAECADPLFSTLFSGSTPRLQKMQISVTSNASVNFEGHANTPALRNLQLWDCPVPWYSFSLGELTCLNLNRVLPQFQQDTTTFLATLSTMRNLRYLYLEDALASAAGFLPNSNTQKTNLPNLSRLFITAPLSTIIAFLTCVDVPLKTEVRLKCRFEAGSSLDNYNSVSSLLSQRFCACGDQALCISAIRSLYMTVVEGYAMLIFTTSLEYYSDDTYEAWDCNIPLKIVVQFERSMNLEDRNHIVANMCRSLPLTDVQSLHVSSPPFSSRFWSNVLGQLPAVRHIKLSDGHMPDLPSVLAISCHATRGGKECMVASALKEVALERIAFSLSEGDLYSYLPGPGPAIEHRRLFAALFSRRHLEGRLTLKRCKIGDFDTICSAASRDELDEQK